jgi:hypothetical protein
MPSRLKTLLSLLLIMTGTSLAANGILTWQWLSERSSFRQLAAAQSNALQVTGLKNKKLSAENSEVKEELTEKDQTLAEKTAALAKKQEELNTLSKSLETKQADLAKAQKQIDDVKSQLSSSSAELSKLRNRPPLFSFQVKSNSVQDVETKKAAVKQVVTDAYDVIESIYGKPYLLHSVTITFVDSFSNDKASGEIVITSSDQGLDYDIHIKDFNRDSFNDTNTIIHEVIHSFHGLSVLAPTAFEEGITVATADAVMAKMIAAGTLPHFSSLYIQLSDSQFASMQSSLSIPRSDSALYGSDDVADYYQVLGKAWYNLYKADSGFFGKFNEKIYARKNAGETITEQVVLDTIHEVAPNAALTGAAWQLK